VGLEHAWEISACKVLIERPEGKKRVGALDVYARTWLMQIVRKQDA